MRNTDDRVRAALSGAKKIKRRRQLGAVATGSTLLSLCLIIALSQFLPLMPSQGATIPTTTGLYASIFANPHSLSYIIIGILSFVLGVSVTLLCVLLHRREGQKRDDD